MTDTDSNERSRSGSAARILRLLAVYLVLAALLWWALKDAPLGEIWNTLRLLHLWQVATLILINGIIYTLITLRWWLIARAGNRRIPFVPLLGVRVAVFGLSYFTLGPQIGGEPLQVLYLKRSHGLTYTRATAIVLMDKLLEFLANFVLLGLGLTAILQVGIPAGIEGRTLAGLAGLVLLLAWPPLHILLLYHRKHPLSALMRRLPFKKSGRFIAVAEQLAGVFCRRYPGSLMAAIGVSILAAAGMVSEFYFITAFLHLDLNPAQAITAWTAGWLAFLVPLPGGLGALEASEVFALGAFGVRPASAISVTLLMRGRDLLIGGLGLVLASRRLRK